MTAEEIRNALDEFSTGDLDVEGLAAAHPDCACEAAAPVTGSHGPVTGDETLRFFLASRSDVDGKRASQLKSRPFKVASLKKAYSVGLSVCRLSRTNRRELEHTAHLLHEIQSAKDGEYGGVLGVVDFPVEAVRQCPNPAAAMCVLETPSDPS